MSDIAVSVENLGKCYQIGQAKSGDFRQSFGSWMDKLRGRSNEHVQESKEFWALKDINFETKKGEAVGIIGRNGAGKSTLLKILSRITEPTKGRFEINGRVSSLLEVGTGFHPELSGRENIYLNGTILGMKRREIKAKFDEIVAFSGVEKFIDTPVKHYSSGMKVRLAFSVAAHLEPEILIIDEVLAVGDAEFQKKCLGKMDEVSKNEGRTVLFVSHNMAAVQSLCDRALVLESGAVVKDSNPMKGIEYYLINKEFERRNVPLEKIQQRKGNGKLIFTDLELLSGNTPAFNKVLLGEKLKIRLKYNQQGAVNPERVKVDLGLNNQFGERIALLSSALVGLTHKRTGEHIIEITIEKLPLMPGEYSVTLFCEVNGDIADWITDAFYFEVVESDFYKTGKMIAGDKSKFLIDHAFSILS
jgi:lipopolysaccharide transport system ATP-binding protein